MKRIAQIMYLNKDKYQEYQTRHENLWPEMKQALQAHGATNYSIFLNKDNGELFAYLEVPDEKRYNEIAKTDVCKKWWHYMAPLMTTNEDESPKTLDLEELFHLK
ncbi:L-rhamnose mutarotase [Companilactobacillus baiquanensis]|uniref:L-rhamnose mutarotase n=1 Tax=Companilactobacillus baiquanensis TaxID=2486005 RepID=A0ABW1UVD7_9LACO|nr:L-rhamnose mutarotase [Companilactobacillus baiquanensis]